MTSNWYIYHYCRFEAFTVLRQGGMSDTDEAEQFYDAEDATPVASSAAACATEMYASIF